MGRPTMTEGYYAMHRGWQRDADFEDDPFSRRDAWVWLIENAAHKDVEIDIKGHPCILQTGQMMHSVRYLAEQWMWGKSTVQRFLKQIEKSGKITLSHKLKLGQVSGTVSGTEVGTPYAVITVCNYTKYQQVSQKAGTDRGTVSGTSSWDNNNNNKDKIYTNTPSETSRSEGLFFEILHHCGFNNIPNDRSVVDEWLALPCAYPSDILKICKDKTAKLKLETGRGPFTLKIFDPEVRAAIAKEQRRQSAERRHQQQIEELEAQKQREAARNAERIRRLNERYGIDADEKGQTVQ